jgi:hypothetical protein
MAHRESFGSREIERVVSLDEKEPEIRDESRTSVITMSRAYSSTWGRDRAGVDRKSEKMSKRTTKHTVLQVIWSFS